MRRKIATPISRELRMRSNVPSRSAPGTDRTAGSGLGTRGIPRDR
jgi:hypothetical protein